MAPRHSGRGATLDRRLMAATPLGSKSHGRSAFRRYRHAQAPPCGCDPAGGEIPWSFGIPAVSLHSTAGSWLRPRWGRNPMAARHSGGGAALYRRLMAATPLGRNPMVVRQSGGIAALDRRRMAATPLGSKSHGAAAFRAWRYARPPAHGCDPAGVEIPRSFGIPAVSPRSSAALWLRPRWGRNPMVVRHSGGIAALNRRLMAATPLGSKSHGRSAFQRY